MNKVSTTIKRLRLEKGINQEQLAEQLHVTRQAVSNWETGKTQPSIETLTALGSLFGISVEALIYGKTGKMDISPSNTTGFGIIFGALFLLIMTVLLFIADTLFRNIWFLIITVSLILAGLVTALFLQAEKLDILASRIEQLEGK